MKILKSRKAIVLTIGIALALGLIILTSTGRAPLFLTNALGFIVVPVQTIMTDTATWASNARHYLGSVAPLLEENARLQQELEELRLNLSRLELLDEQIYTLTALLEMSNRYPALITTGADIIARDSNNWNARFTINKGEAHGVAQNMVLVAQGGLVGKVNFSADTFSQVTPLIDDTSVVGASTVRGGVNGFVRGNIALANQGLVLFETDPGTDIIEGDELITSSFGTIFPAGIHIGTITEIIGIDAGITRAIVEPVVDFSSLSATLVILGTVEDTAVQ